jgi:hypothetical protein
MRPELPGHPREAANELSFYSHPDFIPAFAERRASYSGQRCARSVLEPANSIPILDEFHHKKHTIPETLGADESLTKHH